MPKLNDAPRIGQLPIVTPNVVPRIGGARSTDQQPVITPKVKANETSERCELEHRKTQHRVTSCTYHARGGAWRFLVYGDPRGEQGTPVRHTVSTR